MTKSQEIRNGIQEKFKNGTTKLADRVCYGYTKSPDGHLIISEQEASVVRWIFERYLEGDSLGKIAKGLETRNIPSPTGKKKWNSEAINKLLSKDSIHLRKHFQWKCPVKRVNGIITQSIG